MICVVRLLPDNGCMPATPILHASSDSSLAQQRASLRPGFPSAACRCRSFLLEKLYRTMVVCSARLKYAVDGRASRRALMSIVFLIGIHAPAFPMSAASSPDMPEDAEPAGDMRRFMHGIATVPGPTAGEAYVFFSKANPDEDLPVPGGSWTHDVYVARWDGETGRLGEASRFISRPEAQEPASAARNAAGNIMITFEDGWQAPHTVTQRYGVYGDKLDPVKAYPNEVEPGGHSGHAAAVADDFIVFYSDGWIEGGGEQDLGSGHGVYAKVYDTLGQERLDIDIVHAQRAWWPRLAGGTSKALLIWQELMPNEKDARLKAAVLDPRSGTVGPHLVLHDEINFYHYDVAWMPAIERFLVVGSADDNGFAKLISEEGEVTASLACMPATVREASIAVDDGKSQAYTPAADGRLLQFSARGDSLSLAGTLTALDRPYVRWRTTGSLGLFGSESTLHWLSLTEKGLDQLRFDLSVVKEPSGEDICG